MRRDRIRRGGFTLVELLVVVTIIAILVGLSAAAVGKYIAVSQSNATEATIRKVYTKLMPQVESVVKSAREENMATTVGATNANTIMLLAGNDARRARVIYIKARLKQEFPISFNEALSPTPLAAKQAYVNAFSSHGTSGTGLSLALTAPAGAVTGVAIGTAGSGYPASTTFTAIPEQWGATGCTVSVVTNPAGVPTSVTLQTAGTGYSSATVAAFVAPAAHESAACLLAALQQARRGNSLSSEEFGSTSVKIFSGVNALVDGWGSPLQFVRWPTGSSEVDSLAAPPQFLTGGTLETPTVVKDPQDPDGLLLNNAWYTTSDTSATYAALPVRLGTLGQDFEYYFHAVHKGSVTSSSGMYAFYSVPAIFSAGPNRSLGLSILDMTPDGSNADTDNVYSFRLLPPGARGD